MAAHANDLYQVGDTLRIPQLGSDGTKVITRWYTVTVNRVRHLPQGTRYDCKHEHGYGVIVPEAKAREWREEQTR